MISVGIDIGHSTVKIAEAESLARGFIVKRFLEFPLSLDPSRDKKIEIIDILRNLIPQYNIEHTRFVFCVRQEDVSLRLKAFPFHERHKILRSVPFELEDEIPFSPADAIFEAKITRFDGKMANVLAMACPKDRIRNVVQTAHDSGIHPSLISLETTALSNFMENWAGTPPGTMAAVELGDEVTRVEKSGELLVDFGHESTKCLFYDDGVLVAVRHIDWGGKNVINQIAQKYGLTQAQATRELETKAFVAVDKATVTKEQASFSKVIETSLQNLTKDLRLKVLEIKADNRLNIVKAQMTGGPTMIRGLGGFLTQHLEIPFNRFKVLSLLPSSTIQADERTESVAAVAIGLAIDGLRRPRNPAVDFLKEEFAKQSQTFERFWDKWATTAKLSAVAFVFFLIYAVVRDSMVSSMVAASEETLKAQATAITGLKGTAASPTKIKKFLSDHEKLEKSRKQAEKVLKINSALDVLNLISQNLPEKVVVDVKHFSINGDRAEIEGYVSGSQIRELQTGLQPATLDGKIEPFTSQLPPLGSRQPFAFRFKVSRAEGG